MHFFFSPFESKSTIYLFLSNQRSVMDSSKAIDLKVLNRFYDLLFKENFLAAVASIKLVVK